MERDGDTRTRVTDRTRRPPAAPAVAGGRLRVSAHDTCAGGIWRGLASPRAPAAASASRRPGCANDAQVVALAPFLADLYWIERVAATVFGTMPHREADPIRRAVVTIGSSRRVPPVPLPLVVDVAARYARAYADVGSDRPGVDHRASSFGAHRLRRYEASQGVLTPSRSSASWNSIRRGTRISPAVRSSCCATSGCSSTRLSSSSGSSS